MNWQSSTGPGRNFTHTFGFSLIELLASIAILSVLLALLLPAVQAVRESGRRAQCQDNLKQLSIALLVYHDAQKTFPFGGWGHEWVGHPDRGTGKHQPGGWIYKLLPNIEEFTIHDLGAGLAGAAANDQYSIRMETPLRISTCPSRRPCAIWPVANLYAYVRTPKPFGKVTAVARGDYAINAGASNIFSFKGPADLVEGDDSKFWTNSPYPKNFSGISHLNVAASLKSIEDGTSKTYLVGEKYLEAENYETGASSGDNESLYAGYCTDLHRFTGAVENEKFSLSPFARPLMDTSPADSIAVGATRFGSAHAGGFTMTNCDGAVQFISYDIDPDIHLRAGHRRDYGAPLASLN